MDIDLFATRDVIVNGQLSNTNGLGDIEFRSDTDRNSTGGVVIGAAAQITGTDEVIARGSAVVAAGAGNGLAIFVADDGANTQISSTGAIRMFGNFVAPGESAVVNGVVTGVGPTTITTIQVNDSISLGPNGDLTGGNSFALTLIANAGSITMADGAVVTAGNRGIELEAGADIAISSLQSTGGAIVLAGGAITDNGETDVDFSGTALALQAGTGIGTSGDPLESQSTFLGATTVTGDISISNTGNLNVTDVGIDDAGTTIDGASIIGGGSSDINITTTGSLTLSENVTNASAGNVTLTTTDTAATGEDISVGAVTVSATGDITFNVGDNLSDDSMSNISSSGNVVINIDEGDQDSGTGATAILQGTITAGSLTINGNADADQVNLSGMQNDPAATLNGNAGNDTLTGADGGDLIDGGAGNDTIAGGGGDDTMTAAGGEGTDSIDAGSGSDLLRVTNPASGGAGTITFNGDADSDLIELTGNSVDTVTHTFTSNSAGSITSVSGGTTHSINYTGLEPIDDNLSATDRVFEFRSTSAETITISDDTTADDDISTIDSTEGEIVSFVSPTNSLTVEVNVNGGAGADLINVAGLDSMFDADLTINGGDDDLVAFGFAPTDIGTGNLIARGVAVGVVFGGSIATNGGSVTIETTEEIFISGDVTSGGGNIIFNADTDQLVNPGGSVIIDDAMVISAGGNIVIGGGADPTMTPAIGVVTAPDEDGVRIHESTLSSGTGDISVRGSSALSEDGIDVGDSAVIMSTTGNITFVGEATGEDDGVDIHEGSTISTTSGDISITGTASGSDAEDGVLITGAPATAITTETGAITITGQGANLDSGVHIVGFVLIESTGAAAGAITIDGTSATPELFSEAGTFVEGPVDITSVTGAINITGTSSDGDGLVFVDGPFVDSTGTGATAAPVTLTGDGGLTGVVLVDAAVTSIDGNILVDGMGDDAEGVLLLDSLVESTGTTIPTAATITILGDTTGLDSDGIAVASDTFGSLVSSVAGAISLTGTADVATMGLDGVFIEPGSVIESTGTGANAASITVTGTAGIENGVYLDGDITTVDGDVLITGTATNDNAIEVDSGSIEATGDANVTLTSTDSTATGENIDIGATTISSALGNVTLNSGDTVTIDAGATLSSGLVLQINVDAGNADAGVGETLTLQGTLSAGTGITATGDSDDDQLDATDLSVAVTLSGNGGNDTLLGGTAGDSLDGAAGNDMLVGGGGDDTIDGGSGNELIVWNNGDGSDVIDGGADVDELEVNGSTVTPTGDQFSLTANGTRFDLSRTDGGAGLGAFSMDVGTIETLDLNTLDGDDQVTVNDLTGVADLASIEIAGGDGSDTIDASALPDLGLSVLLEGGNNDDTLTGSAGESTINGNMGNDSLIGGAAADTIMGGGGSDVMNGGSGGDMLSGQAGNDTLTGELGDDTLNGGADTDQIIETGDTDFDLGDASLVSPLTGNDVVSDVEEAMLTGGASANTIDASDFSGTSTLMGGDNNDTIAGAMGESVINGNMGNDDLTGQGAADTIMGGGGNDNIDGGAGGDMLTGQAGNDTMTGGLGDDTLNGGADTDRIVETGDTEFDLGDTSLVSPLLGTDTLSDVEEADLTGGASANTIDAEDFSGNATLMGGSGDDTIEGALGSSVLNGNGDNDNLTGQSAADTILGGSGQDVIDGGDGNDILSGQGSSDTITGNLGNDSISGGGGGDLINGSLGNDTVNGDAGNDRIQGSNLTDYPGTPQMPIPDPDTINLTDQDSLLGGAGADTIAGAIGADFIDGEGDADIIDAQSGGDTTDGIDTIVGGAGDLIFRDPEDTVV